MPRKKSLTAFEYRAQFRKNKSDIAKWLKKNKPRIVGLDVSTSNTGVFFWHGYSSYLISPPVNQGRTARINIIKENLRLLLDQHAPNVAAIEDYSLSLQGSSLSQCAEAGGVVRDLFYEYDIPLFFVAPHTLKKFVLGEGKSSKVKGSEAKSLILLRTFTNWGFQFENDNMCDAFCIAKFLYEVFKYVTGKGDHPKWLASHLHSYIQKRGDGLSA